MKVTRNPFSVKDTGFIKAGDLEEGAVLVDNEGNELHLLIKKWEHLQSPVPVYNFAVEDYHTYFVGSTKVLVHNNCGNYKKGYNAEAALQDLVGGKQHHYIKTSDELGARIIDQYSEGIAYEAKEGYTCCTAFIRKQIEKDVYLMNSGRIDGACWNFFRSPITGEVGASQNLLNLLTSNGIDYIIWNY